MTEEFIRAAETSLSSADPLLGQLIKNQRLEPTAPRSDYFAALTRSIIGQQVSVAAAAAIAKRFSEQTNMSPALVVALDDDEVRAIGLSKQKASYIRDLARHFVDNPAVYNHLEQMGDDEVIADLTAVRGIGTWTAQMFLMFTLCRPDIFAPDDVGLQRAMLKLYKWEELPPKQQLIEISLKWQPYRTIASFHLWQSLDNKPA